jgi:small subunit ribosomal protein S6
MKAYELLVIFNPSLSDDERAAALERVQGLIRDGGSELDNVDDWGKRKLAYEIEKMTDGDYVLFEFKAQPDAIAEIDRVLGITDAVVRFLIVKRDDKSDK